MSDRLAGKVAVVAGAGSVGPGWGNGRAIAFRFAQEGAQVFAADRDLANLDATLACVREIGHDRALRVQRHPKRRSGRDDESLR